MKLDRAEVSWLGLAVKAGDGEEGTEVQGKGGGRVSAARAAAESVARVVQGEFGGKRPEPPAELNERQAEIWRETVALEPVGYFNTGATLAILGDYVRHRETNEKLTGMIEEMDSVVLATREGILRYSTLLRMRELEVRSAANLATKLRLTNQSRFRSEKADKLSQMGGGKKPWD